MNKILVLITSVLLSTSALAMTGSYGLSSDYVWRGMSQTDNKPGMHLGVRQELGNGFYAGAWASNVDINGEQEVEGDFYGGYSWSEDKLSFRLGMVAYKYSNSDNDFEEKFVGMGYGPISIGKALGVDEAKDYEFVDVTLPFIEFAEVKLHYGDYEGIRDKNVTVKYALTDSMYVSMIVQSNVRSDDVELGEAISVHLNKHF